MADESVENGPEKDSPTGVQYQSATAVSRKREKEQLTPELVEDEVARNDFVIRWLVVLMALLFGCTDIRETQTLVHIRAGEVIADNGGWAPANDVLSYTASDRSWVNLGWGFDLMTAGVYGMAGFAGLSLLKALCAAIAFYLVVHISRPGVSSWWGSILAALAVLACYPQFTARPEVITILGIAILLTMLFKAERSESNSVVWQMPVLFLVWANLDPNAWIGLLLLVLFVLGEIVGQSIERARLDNSAFKLLAAGTGLSLVAMCVHRFGYQTFLGPVFNFSRNTALASDARFQPNPTLDQLFSLQIFDEKVLENLSHSLIAGLVLAALCIITMGLNAKRLRMGDAFLFIGAVGLSTLTVHELPVASIIFAVIGTLNAQEWYQSNFRQEYSTATKELLFMRGGRAATVLCLFCIGFLFVSGWINGAAGRRSGFGVQNELSVRAEAYEKDLADAPDDRPFHFTLDQGDLLIWAGKKSFVDNRVVMFTDHDDEIGDLLETHDELRNLLVFRKPEDQQQYPERITKIIKGFNKYKIRYAVPPTTQNLGLAFRGLGFASQPVFVSQTQVIPPQFAVSSLRSLAIFVRTLPENQRYLQEHSVPPYQMAFGKDVEPGEERAGFPTPLTFYETWMHKPKPNTSRQAIEARNYRHWFQVTMNGSVQRLNQLRRAQQANMPRIHSMLRFADVDKTRKDARLAMENMLANESALYSLPVQLMVLTVRRANDAISQDANDSFSYRTLAQAYMSLRDAETDCLFNLQFIDRGAYELARQHVTTSYRFTQIVGALEQSLIRNWNQPNLHFQLSLLHGARRRIDLVRLHTRAWLELTEDAPRRNDAEIEMRASARKQLADWDKAYRKAEVEMDSELAQNKDPAKVADALAQKGFMDLARKLMEEQREKVNKNPMSLIQLAQLQLQCGRVEDAYLLLSTMIKKGLIHPTVLTLAANASLCAGRYQEAIQYAEKAAELQTAELLNVLRDTPVIGAWPLDTRLMTHSRLEQTNIVAALALPANRLLIITAAMEAGRNDVAVKHLDAFFKEYPDSPLRPIAAMYSIAITGKKAVSLGESLFKRIREPVTAPRPGQK